MIKRPKFTKGKLTEAEFDKWLKSGIEVYTFNSDPKNAFYATEPRITRPEATKTKAVLFVVEGK